jgi:hypothetical protein
LLLLLILIAKAKAKANKWKQMETKPLKRNKGTQRIKGHVQ